LNVGIDGLSFEAAGPEVYDFDSRFIHFFKQDVFRLEVSVDNSIFVQEMDTV
jgi:hypothetical protein